jgi:hypothetical protein
VQIVTLGEEKTALQVQIDECHEENAGLDSTISTLETQVSSLNE